jgi:hypothetical protein
MYCDCRFSNFFRFIYVWQHWLRHKTSLTLVFILNRWFQQHRNWIANIPRSEGRNMILSCKIGNYYCLFFATHLLSNIKKLSCFQWKFIKDFYMSWKCSFVEREIWKIMISYSMSILTFMNLGHYCKWI